MSDDPKPDPEPGADRPQQKFEEPVDQDQPKGHDVADILSSYDISMEGVPDQWSATVSKLSPIRDNGVQCVLPKHEELPLVGRPELERVLRDNWGKGTYQVDVRNNGVRKRTITIHITDDDYPPLTKGQPASAQDSPQANTADVAMKMVEKVLEARGASDLGRTLEDLRREIADMKSRPAQPPENTIGQVIASTTQQQIEAMKVSVESQNQAAARTEATSLRQQEMFMQSMNTLMTALKENSDQMAGFQERVFQTMMDAQQRESELLTKIMDQGRQGRAEDMQEMLSMMNVGLNLGSAMAGATSPEEKLIDTAGKVIEKYFDRPGLPAPKDQGGDRLKDSVKKAVRETVDSLKREAAAKAAPPQAEIPAAREAAPKADVAEESREPEEPQVSPEQLAEMKAAADQVLDAIIAVVRDGQPEDILLEALRKNFPQDILKVAAGKPQEMVHFIRNFGDPEKVAEALKHLDKSKMAGVQGILKKAAAPATDESAGAEAQPDKEDPEKEGPGGVGNE